MKPLYVITTVFNPRRFRSRTNLYEKFAAWVAASGVKLLTVEVAFGDRPFAVTEASNPWHLQLRSRHELWLKERALTLGLNHLCRLAPDWGHVAWMDCDIKLARDDWGEETVHMLEHYAVVQMFGEAVLMDPDNHTLHVARSIMRNFEEHRVIDWYDHPGLTFRDKKKAAYCGVRAGHPGLAWAFRREELTNVGGWLDVCVNGSGDLHMAGCYTGRPDLALPEGVNPGYRAAILRYGERCEREVRRNVSFVPGLATHYWHGKAKTRGYEERGNLLVTHQFDPRTDIVADTNGLWRWELHDPRVMALAVDTRRSLAARNEDSNEV